MEDPELAAIRAARMNQLQQQGGSSAAAQGEDEGGKQAAEEQMRRDLLATILDSAARERCTCYSRRYLLCDPDGLYSGADCACQSGQGEAD